MNQKVLFVDDEPNVLEGIRRQLRREFEVHTANGGEAGLVSLESDGPFSVVVSDMRMPGMNGVQFLSQVLERAPDTVRMILSGQSEFESTVAAVNEGQIFRFFMKPCAREALIAGVRSGIEHYELILAEKELREKTLSGAVSVLNEVIGLVNPGAFDRTERIQHYAEGLARHFKLSNDWEVRLAAMLSQLGCVTLPQNTVEKFEAGQELTEKEAEMVASHPKVAARLIERIPRLEGVAEMVRLQSVEDEVLPEGPPTEWEPIVLGAQILRVTIQLERLLSTGSDRGAALEQLAEMPGMAPALVEALHQVRGVSIKTQTLTLTVEEVRVAMVLDEDIMSKAGMRLMGDEQESD